MDAGSSVAFLFTDVVGSTRLWAEHPDAMAADLADHDELIAQAVSGGSGRVFGTGGDSFAAVFPTAAQAAAAAVKLQQALHGHVWRLPDGLTVRTAIHVGVPVARGDDYFGPPLNETARILAAGHGGQVLVSEAAARQLGTANLVDLGEHTLRDLEGTRRLYQLDVPGLEGSHPPVRSLDRHTTTLPAQRSSFVGRREEVGRVRRLLAEHRLVTLTGVGGVGKTRLAVEVAGRELGEFPGGAYFVDLSEASTDDDVPSAIVRGIELGLSVGMDAMDRVVEFVSARPTMLVLDNCEHVLDAVAEAVDRILTGSPGTRILATSREAIGLDGEVTVPVPSLGTTDAGAPAVRLFLERAHAVNPGFDPGAEALAAVVRVCERLDGIPLAIELAAARTRSMTAAEILARLDDRFRLLTGGRRRRSKRQQTLEATIDWSYDLLGAGEQRFLRSLGVLVGGWLLPTGAAVAGVDEAAAVDLVDSLVTKSLVVAVPVVDGVTGYQLLETVREYALRRAADAGEVDSTRERLVDFFAHEEPYSRTTFEGSRVIGFEFANRLLATEEAIERGAWQAAVTTLECNGPGASPADTQRLLELASAVEERAGDELDGRDRLRLAHVAATRRVRLGDVDEASAARFRAVIERYGAADPMYEAICLATLLIRDAHVDPRGALDAIDRAIELALSAPHAERSVPLLLANRAAAFGVRRRHAEAYAAAREALSWCPPGSALSEPAIPIAVWTARLAGAPVDDDVAVHLGRVGAREGWLGHAVRIASVIHTAPDPAELRRALIAVADEEMPGRVPFVDSDFLVVFARLALDDGDVEHARHLVSPVVPRTMGTSIALIDTLARLEGWPDEGFGRHRLQALIRMADPAHRSRSLEEGPRVLAAEAARWR